MARLDHVVDFWYMLDGWTVGLKDCIKAPTKRCKKGFWKSSARAGSTMGDALKKRCREVQEKEFARISEKAMAGILKRTQPVHEHTGCLVRSDTNTNIKLLHDLQCPLNSWKQAGISNVSVSPQLLDFSATLSKDGMFILTIHIE